MQNLTLRASKAGLLLGNQDVLRKLDQIFIWQTLVASGMANLAPINEVHSLRPLLRKVEEIGWRSGAQPFIIVVQNQNLTLANRMERISFAGKAGVSAVDDSGHSDLPLGNYLAVDVDWGRWTLGLSRSACLEKCAKEGLKVGADIEGIMAITYWPGILDNHSIDLHGSLRGGLSPFLSLKNGRPWFDMHSHPDISHPAHGPLTVRERISLRDLGL